MMKYLINTRGGGTLEVPETSKVSYEGFTIIGRGYLDWNEPIQNNFVRLIDWAKGTMDRVDSLENTIVSLKNTIGSVRKQLEGTDLGEGIDLSKLKQDIASLQSKMSNLSELKQDIASLQSKMSNLSGLKIAKETKEFEITDDDVSNGYIDTVITGWQDIEIFYNNKRLIENKQYSFESDKDADGNDVGDIHKIVIDGMVAGDMVTVIKRKVGA